MLLIRLALIWSPAPNPDKSSTYVEMGRIRITLLKSNFVRPLGNADDTIKPLRRPVSERIS